MQRVDFRDQIARNKRKSFFLIIIIFAFFILVGYVITMATNPGYFFFIMIFSIIFSLGYLLSTYYNADKIAIASVKAKKANPSSYPQYHHSVEGLAIASGLPKPQLYIMESPQINAFASGRDPNHAVICVTTGALEKLSKHELEGVLAHELSHIANYDIRFMTMATVMVGLVAIISELFLRSLWFRSGDDNKNGVFLAIGILLAILAPIVTYFVQLSISRKREYVADASAVKFTRYPDGLIKALKKIKYDAPMKKGQASKAIAPLFLSDPFKKKVSELGSTHPSIDKRISTLERM